MRNELGDQHRFRIIATIRTVCGNGSIAESGTRVADGFNQILISSVYPSSHHREPEPFPSWSSDYFLVLL